MHGGKWLLGLLVACCVLVGGATGAPKQDEGVQFLDIVMLPDMDGDGYNDVLVIKSLTRKAALELDNSWVVTFLKNTGKNYWVSVVVLRGNQSGDDWLNEPLMGTPVFYPTDDPILGEAILMDGRLCLKAGKRFLIFNTIVFTPEQAQYIKAKNGWTDGDPGGEFSK